MRGAFELVNKIMRRMQKADLIEDQQADAIVEEVLVAEVVVPIIEAAPVSNRTVVWMYCRKCRCKTESENVEQVAMKNGNPMVKGSCLACGEKVFQFGSLRID